MERDPQVTRDYRENLVKQAKRQWGNDPARVARIEKTLKKLDADHMHELQLGGNDHMSALTMLDRGVNRSVGSQIRHQISQISDGTKITRVIEKGIGQ